MATPTVPAPTGPAPTGPAHGSAHGPAPAGLVRGSVPAVLVAAALVGGCAAAGFWLTRHGTNLVLGSAYPLTGHYRLHLSGWLAPAVLAAAALLRWAPRQAATLPWRWLLAASWPVAAGWAVALALVGGPEAIAAPLASRHEYLFDVDRIDAMGVRTYLHTFTWYVLDDSRGPQWTTHVSGHPPLATLVFVLLARAGLAGPGWAAALCILAGAGAAPAVLGTLRRVGDEVTARRAAPFVVAAPAALWIATSADAMFAGVAAAGVCALAHAVGAAGPWRRSGLALAGGLALGACLMLSYGLVLLAPIALAAVAAAATRAGTSPAAPAVVLAIAAVGVAAVLAGFGAAGFWWLDGLAVAARRVVAGGGWQSRPAAYFVFANPAALAVVVGPATVAAVPALLTRLRVPPRLDWLALPAAALCAVALAIASNLAKGEVERIYLPFAVWLLPLAAVLRGGHRWFAANLAFAVVLAGTTRLSW